jgi:hypothetical protein
MSSLESQFVYQRVQTISRVTGILSDVTVCYPISICRTYFFLNQAEKQYGRFELSSLIKDEVIAVLYFIKNLGSPLENSYSAWEELIDTMKSVNTISVLCKQECSVRQVFRIAMKYLVSVLIEEITVSVARIKVAIKGIDEWNDKILAMKLFEPIVDDWNQKLIDYWNGIAGYWDQQRSTFVTKYDGEYKYMIELIRAEQCMEEREVKWWIRSSSIQPSITIRDFFRVKVEESKETEDKSKRAAELRDFFVLTSNMREHEWFDGPYLYSFSWLGWKDCMERMELMKEKTRQIMERYTSEEKENEKKAVEIL